MRVHLVWPLLLGYPIFPYTTFSFGVCKMKYYITKYVLSGRIHYFECEPHLSKDGYVQRPGGYWDTYLIGHDAFEHRADAEARALQMIEKKRQSLLRSLAKLDGPIKFDEE